MILEGSFNSQVHTIKYKRNNDILQFNINCFN